MSFLFGVFQTSLSETKHGRRLRKEVGMLFSALLEVSTPTVAPALHSSTDVWSLGVIAGVVFCVIFTAYLAGVRGESGMGLFFGASLGIVAGVLAASSYQEGRNPFLILGGAAVASLVIAIFFCMFE